MQCQPIDACITALKAERDYDEVIFTTPDGEQFNQPMANALSMLNNVIILCGHYKGIDYRIREHLITKEVSIGDFVLTGGELAALAVADSVLRLQPGVLAEQKGYEDESFWDGLLEYPQYTRPEVWEGRAVPPILLSGDHGKVDAWRRRQSEARTEARRPDLWAAYQTRLAQEKPPAEKKKHAASSKKEP